MSHLNTLKDFGKWKYLYKDKLGQTQRITVTFVEDPNVMTQLKFKKVKQELISKGYSFKHSGLKYLLYVTDQYMNQKQEEFKKEGLENAVKSKVKPEQVEAIKQFEEEKKQWIQKGWKPKPQPQQEQQDGNSPGVSLKVRDPKQPKP